MADVLAVPIRLDALLLSTPLSAVEAKAAEEGMIFPAVPNRWLVARSVVGRFESRH